MTELVFIIDRSGSMNGMEKDTVGSFNSMIQRQKQKSGEALVTTVLFSSQWDIVHDRLPLNEVPEILEEEYQVQGYTALLDTVGDMIEHIKTIQKYARPEDVPQKTLFVIITDGLENVSRRYDYSQIKEMIQTQQEESGWEFLFLAADIDAAAEAAKVGIPPEHTAEYQKDSQGTAINYQALSQVIQKVRSGQAIDSDWKRIIENDRKRSRR